MCLERLRISGWPEQSEQGGEGLGMSSKRWLGASCRDLQAIVRWEP